jgi:membrane-bound lytic murein transglycosylase D
LTSKQEDVAGHIADNGQLALAPEVQLRRSTVKAGKHDSVASIAKRFRVAPAQVAEWNSVGPTAAFKPGQPVVVYLPVRAAAPRAHGPGHGHGPRAQAPAARRQAAPAARKAAPAPARAKAPVRR